MWVKCDIQKEVQTTFSTNFMQNTILYAFSVNSNIDSYFMKVIKYICTPNINNFMNHNSLLFTYMKFVLKITYKYHNSFRKNFYAFTYIFILI